MEDYLQNMKILYSQMIDVENQAAKIVVEEETQITAIHAMEKDLDFAKSEARQLKETTERLLTLKGQICSQILQKQMRIASLEVDSSTLSQTLELIIQERVSLSSKLLVKRTYYSKIMEDLSTKLRERQNWFNSYKLGAEMEFGIGMVKEENAKKIGVYKVTFNKDMHPVMEGLGLEANKNHKDLKTKLACAKAKLENIREVKSKLLSETNKMPESIEQLKKRKNDFLPELRLMDKKNLEAEHSALLSDKAAESKYLQNLEHQIEQLKGISHVSKCACGEEYEVEMNNCG